MENNNKIALLFLTRKEINHARVWQQLIEKESDKFNIYIHAKEPMEDEFFKKYQIPHPVPTTYFIHVKAWQVLVQEALKNKHNVKFVYLSESCMPIYPLGDLHHYLTKDSTSYMRYSTPWWEKGHAREVKEIPVEHRLGNAEWVILNRKHAEIIAQDQEIIDTIAQYINDQESHPSSLFSMKGCLDEVTYRQTTYASYVKPSGPYPYHFREGSYLEENYIQNAKRGGCLFARKFTPEFPSEALLDMAHERLLPPVSSVSLSQPLKAQVERKLSSLQTQEEMSQANLCTTLPLIMNKGFFEIGYEIGVGVGLHMERLMQAAHVDKLYGVDEFNRKSYQGIAFDSEEETILQEYVQKRLEPLSPQIELLRQSSQEVARTVKDQSIDFVFFNYNHCLDPICDNLNAWFLKVRKGGVIAGYRKEEHYSLDVLRQFFKEKGLEVHQEKMEPNFWWVQL